MRLFPGQYVLILVLFSSYAVHARVVQSADAGSSVIKPPRSGPQTSGLEKLLQGLIDFLQQIPFIGNLLVSVVEVIVRVILTIELLTNGAIGRLLGGALPCEISLDNGFECTGISENGGLSQLLMNTVDSLPDIFPLQILKEIFKGVLKGFVNPFVDVLLGGQLDIKDTK